MAQEQPSETPENFRKAAERKQHFDTVPLQIMSDADIAALIRELRIRETELEMHTEALRTTQLELEESKAKYADLFDLAPIGYFVLDEGGHITEVNLAGVSLLQDDRDKLIGESFERHVLDADRGIFQEHRRLVAEKASDHECVVTIRGRDGEERTVRLRSRPMSDTAGTGQGVTCRMAATDITEKRRAEEALAQSHADLEERVAKRTAELKLTIDKVRREAEAKIAIHGDLVRHNETLQAIIDNIPVMLCFYDAQGRVALINEEFERVLGYTLEDFEQRSVMDWCYPDPGSRQQAWEHMMAAGTNWVDLQVTAKDRRKIATSWANVCLSDGSYVGIGIDIRQRKNFEDRLRNSEERYRTLVELSPDGIVVKREGTIQFVNSTACRLMGAAGPEELIGREVLDLVHPDYRERTAKQLQFLRHRRKPLRVSETKFVRLDGAVLDIEMAGMPIAFENEPATQIVLHDITQRKEAEARLRANAFQIQQQAALLDLAHDTILVHDLQGQITFWNRGAERTYGYSKAQAIGRISHELLKTRFPKDLRDIIDALIQKGRWNGELIHTTAHGETLVVSSRWALQYDQSDTPCGILEIDRDITERKQAEQVIAEARRFAESVIETIQEALVVLDGDLKVLSANRTFYNTFEVNPEETVGRAIYEIGNHQWNAPRLRELLEDILPHNTSFEDFEVEHDFEHIGHRTMLLNARRIYREARQTEMILLAIQDVTVRKRQEREILENQGKLAELTEELLLTEERERRRIATALHDSIGQSLAFSKRELGLLRKEMPPSLLERLDRTKTQIDDAIRQTRSLTFELSPSTLYTFGLEAALEELAEQFAERRGFQCHPETSGDSRPLSDQVRVFLYRAARELLVNIAKHAEARHVWVRVQYDDEHVQIEVEDDGLGFDVSELQSTGDKRRGFGLYSIRERLTRMKGSFAIESKSGEGTKVTMRMPIPETDANDSRGDLS